MPPKAGGGGDAVVSSANSAAIADRNKVVVRRCPAELPPAIFWTSVEAWTGDADVDWKAVSADSN